MGADELPAPALPADYAERVYAGVLGKIIGVYLGRPIEGWLHERIEAELGEITGYVHERLGRPLVAPDDDISGAFIFIRALEDEAGGREITPAAIGRAWLNYLIEERTVLWWGGFGNATAHTAYLRLKRGLEPPASGAAATNGQVVAEQIAAQIFVDSWALAAPGDPELAADLARRAACVSSDGAAVHGAQVVAAMEAAAFTEPDVERLLDTALALIPGDSIIARLIHDVREWHQADGGDRWRDTFRRIRERYGYDRYGGNCHVVPNHALVILALLAGAGDFDRSLLIANTAGWDTDCNSGTVGCLLGVRGGLAAIGERWRAPVADRLYLPSADAGGVVTDATRVADRLAALGHRLAGAPAPDRAARKGGARFHFEYPGSLQGFRVTSGAGVVVENVAGHSAGGTRSLALRLPARGAGAQVRVTTPTFFPLTAQLGGGYGLHGSPALHPGQRLRYAVSAAAGNRETLRLAPVTAAATEQGVSHLPGPPLTLAPGASADAAWVVPETGGDPLAEVGLQFTGPGAAGTVYLDYLGWDGVPCARLGRPGGAPAAGGRPLTREQPWRRAWADGIDQFENRARAEDFRLLQNRGTGLLIRGDRDWRDYAFAATVRIHMARSGGIGVRVQGMRRYYALLVTGSGLVRLVRRRHQEAVLAETRLRGRPDQPHRLILAVRGSTLTGCVDGETVCSASDSMLDGGAVALLCEEGRVEVSDVKIGPEPP